MKKIIVILISLLLALPIFATPSVSSYPSSYFDLNAFKLQYPGPSEQKNLLNFSSNYFYSSKSHTMSFFVVASATGHTQNSEFVRSELRHSANWYVSGSSTMSATLSVDSYLTPNKITVMQIHGETKTLDNAPPLLRIALNNGSLYAMIKTSMSDTGTQAILLEKNINNQTFQCRISVQANQLKIWIDNTLKVNLPIRYWHYMNYFKIGAYPQSHEGYATVTISDLSVNVN